MLFEKQETFLLLLIGILKIKIKKKQGEVNMEV